MPVREIKPCAFCGKNYLEGYPHRHDPPVSPHYNPMPAKPRDFDELVALIRAEYLSEIPGRLHVSYVPNRAEPIGVSQYSAEAAGIVSSKVDALDTGELGSPSWSPAFHRYVGGVTVWEGEQTMDQEDLKPTPWTLHLDELRVLCSGQHRTWYEHRFLPLCWTLVRLMMTGYTLDRAAQHEGISPEKARDLLEGAHRGQVCTHRGKCPEGAFDKWWAWVSNDLNGINLNRKRLAS